MHRHHGSTSVVESDGRREHVFMFGGAFQDGAKTIYRAYKIFLSVRYVSFAPSF
jgi:hypothetical protein